VTGYSAEGIDRRFAQIPVLQKPIERQMLRSAFIDRGRAREEGGAGIGSQQESGPMPVT
jgi:hypothetical protein